MGVKSQWTEISTGVTENGKSKQFVTSMRANPNRTLANRYSLDDSPME